MFCVGYDIYKGAELPSVYFITNTKHCWLWNIYEVGELPSVYFITNTKHCWLWNIYEGGKLPSVYFITNTKHCITYLALTQLFPVIVSRPEMYTLCSMLLHFV